MQGTTKNKTNKGEAKIEKACRYSPINKNKKGFEGVTLKTTLLHFSSKLLFKEKSNIIRLVQCNFQTTLHS